MTKSVGVIEFRQNAGATLDRVQGGERITITRFSRAIAALVPITDLEQLEGRMNNQQPENNAPRRRTINQQTPGQFLREFMATHDMTPQEVRRFLLRAIEAMDDLEDAAE